jgi:hypothetical protein
VVTPRSPSNRTADDPSDEELADLVSAYQYDLLPEQALSKLVTWYHNLDVALATNDWEFGEDLDSQAPCAQPTLSPVRPAELHLEVQLEGR